MRIESERLLLVEGPDDQNLLKALIHHWPNDAHPDVQFIVAHGVSTFKAKIDAIRIAARRDGRNLRAIGIVRDADQDAAGAWRSERPARRRRGLALSVSDPDVSSSARQGRAPV